MSIFDIFKRNKKNNGSFEQPEERGVVMEDVIHDEEQHVITEARLYNDGSVSASFRTDDEVLDFFELSQMIQTEKDLGKKVLLCEKALEFLPEFCRFNIDLDGELPPLIACRDAGPWAYMKLGMYDEAKVFTEKCIDANAFFPGDGSDVLQMIQVEKAVSEKILSFLRENPGFMQRNIYKHFSFDGEEKEAAQRFLKYSTLLRKEKSGSTNKLYVD